MAGYKALWHKKDGYPKDTFLKKLHPALEGLGKTKLKGDVRPAGTKAGEINRVGAALTGLMEGTAVSATIIDAHAAVPGVGITEPGKMFVIIGTSMCHLLLGEEERFVPGISGVVEDGILPGYFGYEAGQVCMGDHFAWFAEHACPAEYVEEAKARGIKVVALLDEMASKLKPGESGLIALDWWNGNRSVLVDADLSGMVLGCTLQTKAEEIYRALVEATIFGTRMIVETFRENKMPVNEILATGGIALKSPFVMQVFADVMGMRIEVSKASQAGALGSAMFGAVAAGKDKGGYDDIREAAKAMACKETYFYEPVKERTKIYDELYREYQLIHDYFGRGENNVMKRLKQLKEKAKA